MRYYGDFRSLDQSVDKKGQKYRVLIFTGYDPTASGRSHTGPYPWSRRMKRLPIIGEEPQYIYYPNKGTELTMTDNPFIVKYAGDTGRLYKPYRCSTASVSFLQSTLNQDFINALGQSVLVVLLKWNNDVYESSPTTMKNVVTGETITKHRYQYYDELMQEYRTVYYDYDPWVYDKFCYTVEWVGFSTPTMLNVEYDHIVDAFTLECQDALSTLQYTEFARTDQMEDMLMTLFRMLATLGTYRDIFVTTSIHLPAATNDPDARIPTTGNAMRWIAHQQDNFINEDGEPFKYMDVLEDMMEYLGLTAIPYQDKLYIINSTALGTGHNDYNRYQFQSDNDILPWILPAEMTSTTPTVLNDVNIVDTVHLDKDSFCGGTQLSSDSMYNKVKIVCDEMRPDPLLPDLGDDQNFQPETTVMDQPIASNLWNRHSTSDPSVRVNDNFHYTEIYLNRVADGVDNIKFFRYETGTSISWNFTQLPVTDNDLIVSHKIRYAGQTIPSGQTVPNTPLLDWVSGIQEAPSSQGGSYGPANVMACMIDLADSTVNNETEKPTSMSFSRSILLATPANSSYPRSHTVATSDPYDWDDKSNYWMPMVYLKSKPFLANGKQYINFSGDFSFYGRSNIPGGWIPVAGWTDSAGHDNNTVYYGFDANYNYMWMKIKCGDFYLTDTGRGNYSWTDTESYVRMWCDNAGKESGVDYRATEFPLETTVRDIEGITVDFSPIVPEGYAKPMQVEIWIDRPLGPGSTMCCGGCKMDNFEVNIFSKEYVESRKRRNPDRDNTEYSNEIISGAVEEYPEVGLIHSSCDTAGLSYSETARHTIRRRTQNESVWKTNPKVISDGDGYYGLPEEVNIRSMKHQLETPTIVIQTALFNMITPISRVMWQQMADKKFIVDSLSINYEYEQCDANLIEVKGPSTVTEYGGIYRANTTRNYHRTRDLMFDGHVARRFMTEISGAPVIVTNDVTTEDYEVTLDTPNEALGGGNLNMDWDSGEFRLTAPSEGNMSAHNTNGEVFITV